MRRFFRNLELSHTPVKAANSADCKYPTPAFGVIGGAFVLLYCCCVLGFALM